MEGKNIMSMMPSSGLLIIGSEGKGVRPELMDKATQKITIPRIGEAESLNVAVATGIIVSRLVWG
jgi:TrmH family RNA methyltransferase